MGHGKNRLKGTDSGMRGKAAGRQPVASCPRCAAPLPTATLFGSYAHKVRYGVLSLNNLGLPTYGDICCRLRSVAVRDRTSFLETNSYEFVKLHGVRAGEPIPLGFRAVWDNRHFLALAKLVALLQPRQARSDWEALMFRSDGLDRSNDDFIEAHIFGGFDREAVEDMIEVAGKRLDKSAKLDARLAVELFRKRRVAEGSTK